MAKSKKVKKGNKSTKKIKRPAKVKKASMRKSMPAKELKKYKALLLTEREKISEELSHITQDALNKSQRDASGDLSGYSYHMADMASDNYERDFSLSRASDEQNLLYRIDEAFKRIEEGTYGGCMQCDKPIPKKRLEALPHSELCIECQKKNENK